MKNPSKKQVGLKKLPKDVRNNMGYFANGGSVEVDGVMQEHYIQPMEASMKDENSGFSRGGGAALRGTKFRGVR
tara:strand:+ start:264 stop:485 length:222 start_codon:yes stop_codon:yes gene_type:complete